jgi:hypothetical protein
MPNVTTIEALETISDCARLRRLTLNAILRAAHTSSVTLEDLRAFIDAELEELSQAEAALFNGR